MTRPSWGSQEWNKILKYLRIWNPPKITYLLGYLFNDLAGFIQLKRILVDLLKLLPPKIILVYFLQIFQCLRFDNECLLEKALLKYSKASYIFNHKLMWNLIIEKNAINPKKITLIIPEKYDNLKIKSEILFDLLYSSMSELEKEFYTFETEFIYQVI